MVFGFIPECRSVSLRNMRSASPESPAGLTNFEFASAGQWSCAVKDSSQLIRVFAFALESAADSGEGLGERKNVVRDKQIGIFRSDRMPVHTLG
ncbi:MAG: hypothetical protein JWO80_5104, partial [Bryobacterales bacterium]|nr:hypothetical protein [Bryobacterales bacterium]